MGTTNNGKGNRIIDTVPPSPINHCANSKNIPATFGNCDTFCMVVDQIGNQMEYYSKAMINHTNTEYTAIESFTMTPTGGIGPTNSVWEEFFAPLAIGEYRSAKQSFDVTTYGPQCMYINSTRFIDNLEGYRMETISKKIKVP